MIVFTTDAFVFHSYVLDAADVADTYALWRNFFFGTGE
jgi:hypothetical protein